MDWVDEPATEQQLIFLGRLGYVPTASLSRCEAARLIREFQTGKHPAGAIPAAAESDDAFELRKTAERAKAALAAATFSETAEARQRLEAAVANRQDFWLDTCREPAQMRRGSPAVLELYKKYGCLFFAPGARQAEVVLAALDAAWPVWDRDHPELFYQTLELNFPELARRV